MGHELTTFIEKIIDAESHKKKNQFRDINYEVPVSWFFNSMGCIVVCSTQIKNYHYDWDLCLTITMQPLYTEKAVMVVDEKGKIIGVSDLARFY